MGRFVSKMGHSMDLSTLADFNLVAAQGGFGRASRVSGRPKATLSRRIMALEESLGVRLIERGARALRLTEEGERLFARTEGLLSELAEVEAEIGAGQAQPRGRLRIAAPILFSHTALARVVAGFAAAYPEVRIEAVAEDRRVDLVEEGYDLAIRINPAPTEGLVGRCFARDQMLVVAPVGMPRPEAGAKVRAVVRTAEPAAPVWTLAGAAQGQSLEAEPVLRLSSILMVRDAVRAGAGAALLPRSMVAEDLAAGRLVSWGEAEDRAVELWVLHLGRRLASRKVTAFVEFVCAAFPRGVLE